jgi:hypothetical protein
VGSEGRVGEAGYCEQSWGSWPGWLEVGDDGWGPTVGEREERGAARGWAVSAELGWLGSAQFRPLRSVSFFVLFFFLFLFFFSVFFYNF